MRNRILTVLGVVAVLGVLGYILGIRMTRADLHISAAAEPLFCIGGTLQGELCSKGAIPFTNSTLTTIIVDLILIGVGLTIGRNLKLIPSGLQNIVESLVEGFYNFTKGVDPKNVAKFFPIPATIFLFFLVGNLIALFPPFGSIGACVPKGAEHSTALALVGSSVAPAATPTATSIFANWPGSCYGDNLLIPFFRAPAADLNVTFAFALVAGVMIEVMGFQALGAGYLKKFFVNPFKEGFIQTLVGALELIGEFTRIISFAFRIFGNIFGGEVVLVVMTFLFPYILPLPFYGLEVFVAFIQAVIFAVLTVVFFSLAATSHDGHDEAYAADH